MICFYYVFLLLLSLVSAQNATGPSANSTVIDEGEHLVSVPTGGIKEVTVNVTKEETPPTIDLPATTVKIATQDFVSTNSTSEQSAAFKKVTIPVSVTESSSETKSNASAPIANSRSFLIDSDDFESLDGDDGTIFASSHRPEEYLTKPHKIKKKVLISRPKTSTEILILSTDNSDVPNDVKYNESKDFDDSTESNSIQKNSKPRTDEPTRDPHTRSFRFPDAKGSATDITTSSSLLITNIQKLISNNLLNVIDTTVRPTSDEVTSSSKELVPNRNTIKFDADDFGTTGQSDWVPLVSDKGSHEEWSPVASFSRTTVHPIRPTPNEYLKGDSLTEASTKRPLSTSMQTIVVIDSPSTPSKASVTPATEMDLSLGTAPWTLASSLFTRTENSTVSPSRSYSPIVQALNNTLQRKIKENVLSSSAPVSEEVSENFTKEHNQVLKNTIPDSVLVETTPSPKWWSMSTTLASSIKLPTKSDIISTMTVDSQGDTTSSEEISTAAFEIMKVTTSEAKDLMATTNAPKTVEVVALIKSNATEKLVAVASESPYVNLVDAATENSVGRATETDELPITTVDTSSVPIFYSTSKPEVLDSSSSEKPNMVFGSSSIGLETFASSTSIKPEVTLSNVILPITIKPDESAVNSTEETQRNNGKTTFLLTTTEQIVTHRATELANTEELVTVPFTSPMPPVIATKSDVPVMLVSESNFWNAEPTTPKDIQTEATTTPKHTTPTTSIAPEVIIETSTVKIIPPPKVAPEPITEEVDTSIVHTEATTVFGIEGVTSREDDRTEDDNRTILSNSTDTVEELSEENVPAYLRLTVLTSESELCHRLPELHTAILKMLSEGTNTNVSGDSIILLNLTPHLCKHVSKLRPEDDDVRQRPVNMFLMDDLGGFNKNLSEVFLTLWGHAGLDFPLPILKVDFVTPIVGGEMGANVSSGVVAAIAISAVAGICLILLGILFVIMKRRQKKFNYGQRCTPVSLDAYSLDSVSIRNSARRKNIRASKRSYGNPAFDDPEITSHILNFAGLANFSAEKEQIQQEFAVIPQVSPRVDEYPPGVETKNRYANVIPLPETRVVLQQRSADPLSDYINANFVRGYNNTEKTYIAAQAPLEATLPDWWRMVWEQQVKVILMLTALSENGVDKCADYLPPSEVTDSIRMFGDFQVTLKKRDVKEKYIVSTIQLKNMETNLWREVSHLWYLGWPDSGVPAEPNSLIAFLIEARSQMKTSSGSPAPTLVHCSPGTGRTGTVIACDVCIREFEQNRVVDIPRCVYQLRRARAGAVQTRDQYAFIYLVLNTYATKLTGGALENI